MILPGVEPSFCQFCGGTLTPGAGGSDYVCGRCGRMTYLNSKPSACAVVIRNGQVLLVADKGSDTPSWDVPGGFLLYGESPEDGLRREVREELNADISVGELLAAKVDTYGVESHYTLNLFFRAELLSDNIETGAEVVAFGWFRLRQLPSLKYRSTFEVLTSEFLLERK